LRHFATQGLRHRRMFVARPNAIGVLRARRSQYGRVLGEEDDPRIGQVCDRGDEISRRARVLREFLIALGGITQEVRLIRQLLQQVLSEKALQGVEQIQAEDWHQDEDGENVACRKPGT